MRTIFDEGYEQSSAVDPPPGQHKKPDSADKTQELEGEPVPEGKMSTAPEAVPTAADPASSASIKVEDRLIAVLNRIANVLDELASAQRAKGLDAEDRDEDAEDADGFEAVPKQKRTTEPDARPRRLPGGALGLLPLTLSRRAIRHTLTLPVCVFLILPVLVGVTRSGTGTGGPDDRDLRDRPS